MRKEIFIHTSLKKNSFPWSRKAAKKIRDTFEDDIIFWDGIVLNFEGVENATQSFMDELVGVLVLNNWPKIVSKIWFRWCNEKIEKLILYVADKRSNPPIEG